uniref:Uncharacterized protein n=1 Tax=Rhizophora mucronata TaxID=61149 RepID=A0A2P2QWW7_RHIMU
MGEPHTLAKNKKNYSIRNIVFFKRITIFLPVNSVPSYPNPKNDTE